MSTTVVPTLPDGASAPKRLYYGLLALNILKDDAGNPKAGALINRCFDHEVWGAHAERMRIGVDGERLLAERPGLQQADLNLGRLAQLPEGTLGRSLALYFEHNGFPPFDTDQPTETDSDYLSKRYRETHDCYHVITEYKTDDMGEMELQAFVMGNLGIRSGWVITVLAYLPVGAWKYRFHPLRYIRLLRAAYKRGAQARPFLEFPFEDHWETPVSDVRALMLTARAS